MSLKSSICISYNLSLLGSTTKHRGGFLFFMFWICSVIWLWLYAFHYFKLALFFPAVCSPLRAGLWPIFWVMTPNWETLQYRMWKLKPKWGFQNFSVKMIWILLKIMQKICFFLDPSFKNIWFYSDNIKFKE